MTLLRFVFYLFHAEEIWRKLFFNLNRFFPWSNEALFNSIIQPHHKYKTTYFQKVIAINF